MGNLKTYFYTKFLLFALDILCKMYSSKLPFLFKKMGKFPPRLDGMQHGPQGLKLGTRKMICLK